MEEIPVDIAEESASGESNASSAIVKHDPIESNIADNHQTEDNPKCNSPRTPSESTSEMNEMLIKCSTCDDRFKDKNLLESHAKEFHSTVKEVRHCQKCFKIFPSMKSFYTHKCIKISSYVCGTCGRPFSTKFNLMKHMETHREKPEFSCSKCNYKCTTKYRILAHKKSHGDVPLKCSDCGSECIDEDDLAKHVCDRPDLKKFICEICGKTFERKYQLSHHQTIHLEESNFECDLCDKKFKSEKRLSAHKKHHSNEKRFVCQHCSKKFRQSTHLKIHLRVHTGETPYKCKFCEKAYPWETSLKLHMKHHAVV